MIEIECTFYELLISNKSDTYRHLKPEQCLVNTPSMTSIHSPNRRISSSLLLAIITLSLFNHTGWSHGTVSPRSEEDPRKISFPDTANYHTLVLDPHTHSAFSDGHVWPRIRVEEALRDGLDALAITEHLEYQPHIADIPHPDRNRAYEDAANAAKNTDVIVIPGAEITRDMPASHMNALFISDANKLLSLGDAEAPKSSRDHSRITEAWPPQNAVQAAHEQGAFIFWNHAWWTNDFPNGIPTVSEFHQNNINNGLLHGIEVANGKYFSEDAFQIALDHNLTLIGCSDIHNLIDWDYEPHKGGHRPVTLVMAEEHSAESIKDALFDRRTVVWYKNWLIGRKEHLDPLLQSCLSIEEATYGKGEILAVTINNQSDADFHLRNLSPYGFHEHADTLVIPQHSSQRIMVRTPTRLDSIALKFEVLNAFTAPRNTTTITLESPLPELSQVVSPDSGLVNPFGVAFDDDGAMLIAEYEGGRLWKYEFGKHLQRLAADIPFNGMHNLVRTSDGRIYISDTRANYIRMIDEKTGKDSIVAGTGEAGYNGDNILAKEASLHDPISISLSPDERRLYIADIRGRRVRYIDLTTGIIHGLAGNGTSAVPEGRRHCGGEPSCGSTGRSRRFTR